MWLAIQTLVLKLALQSHNLQRNLIHQPRISNFLLEHLFMSNGLKVLQQKYLLWDTDFTCLKALMITICFMMEILTLCYEVTML